MAELAVYDNDPTIYLFTSLTAGSSHIITATSRIETILKANKIPFKGVDTATDELAKKLFQRRASGKKLPLVVKEGYVLGGITEIEEWNEYDEIREALGVTTAFTPLPAKPSIAPAASSSATATTKKENIVAPNPAQNLAIRQLGAEAAKAAAAKKQAPAKISTTNPLLTEKTNTPTSATASATGTPTKAKADGGILSPKSIPLPQTPKTPASAGIPNLANLQKGVKAPPKISDDAENLELGAGPVSETTDSKKDEKTELKGAKVDKASETEIKKVEKDVKIEEKKKEEEEEEEDDSEEEEDDDDDEEDSEADDDEESSDEEEDDEEIEGAAAAKKPEAVKTQDQDAKDPSKAGESVKEGEQEEPSDEEPAVKSPATPTSTTSTKPATESKSKSSNSKKKSSTSTTKKSTSTSTATEKKKSSTSTTTDKDKDKDKKKSTTDTKKPAAKKKSAAKPSLLGALAGAPPKKKATDKKKTTSASGTTEKKVEGKAKETKTQSQDAKDGSKAGESVKD